MNAPQIEYCLYARKSSESDERQAMSIDSQIKEMQTVAKRENILIKEIREESHSASPVNPFGYSLWIAWNQGTSAGVEGIEPPLAVLETAVLPLNDTPNLDGLCAVIISNNRLCLKKSG